MAFTIKNHNLKIPNWAKSNPSPHLSPQFTTLLLLLNSLPNPFLLEPSVTLEALMHSIVIWTQATTMLPKITNITITKLLSNLFHKTTSPRTIIRSNLSNNSSLPPFKNMNLTNPICHHPLKMSQLVKIPLTVPLLKQRIPQRFANTPFKSNGMTKTTISWWRWLNNSNVIGKKSPENSLTKSIPLNSWRLLTRISLIVPCKRECSSPTRKILSLLSISARLVPTGRRLLLSWKIELESWSRTDTILS